MPRLPPDRIEDLLAAVRAGKTAQIIATETGVSESTIRYLAAKHGLTVTSRYKRVLPGLYWHQRLKTARIVERVTPAPAPSLTPNDLRVAMARLKDWG